MLNTSLTKSSAESQNFIVLENKFVIIKNIYKGSTHNLYIAIKKNESKHSFIVKMKKKAQQELNSELFYLLKLKNLGCIPNLVSNGEEKIRNTKYEYQIFEKMGPSIKLLRNYLSRNMPIHLICLLAIHTLNSLEKIHQTGIIHRNIRPKKLMISVKGGEVLVSDFKNACKYRNINKQIVVQTDNFQLNNKAILSKYSSINSHLGQIPSPKDDLESLAYLILFYTNCGQTFNKKYENKMQKIKEIEQLKLTLLPEQQFKGAPIEFIQFLLFVRMSNANDYPKDYEDYRNLFRKTLLNLGYQSEKQINYPCVDVDKNLKSSNYKLTKNHQTTGSIQEEADDEVSLDLICPTEIDGIAEEQSIIKNITGLQQLQFNNPHLFKPVSNQIIKLKDLKKRS